MLTVGLMSSRVAPALLAVLLALSTACAAPTGTAGPAGDGTSIVLGESYESPALNPLLGYGEEGRSKIFEGLVEHDDQLRITPALAASVPTTSPDGRSWTATLRDGVRFHDGSGFDADDVVATYRAVLDPAYASTVKSNYGMLAGVEKIDARTVRFDLAYPYASFPNRLTLGILPAEALTPPRPAESLPINARPIGTGPYLLREWRRGSTMTLDANERYRSGVPAIKTLTVVFADDDNTRAQRMQAGEFDATDLPPALAQTFVGRPGLRVFEHKSADYRVVTMPMSHPVTRDPAVRKALNLAANRPQMISALLAGKGSPASTPVPEVLGEFVEPSARFGYDPAEAGRILDAAGWATGPDGVRARDGVRAAFTLMYAATDAVRKDLAIAFASDARAVGFDIALEGLGWDAIEPRLERDALVMGGGSQVDPDVVIYPLLHSSFGGDGFNNPGSYNNPGVDAGLDAARRATSRPEQVAAVKAWQRAYAQDPGMVFLVFLDHSYVMRERWSGYRPVVDPHSHGVLTWGPMWNIETWVPRP